MGDEHGSQLSDVSRSGAELSAVPEQPTLSESLRAYTTELLDLLRKRLPYPLDLTYTLKEVARISGRALRVARTSVWLFEDGGERLVCKVLLSGGEEQPTDRVALPTSASPAYFRAIGRVGVVAVEDVLDDPRTVGLEAYVRAHDIRALLDISIAIPGEVLGVVCHEHTGGRRGWRAEEIDFARHVGDLIALALEAERRQGAEARARGSEAKYRYLVESLPVTVYSFHPFSQKVEYLSPQIRELGAFDADKLLARGVSAWIELIAPEDRALVLARLAPGGVDRVPSEIQYRITPQNGSVRYIRDQCRVVRNHAGEPIAIQGVLTDITEQRRAEARSAELERRFRSLLEGVDLIALVLDCDGRAEFVNRCFERVTGYDAEQVLGADCFALLIPPDDADSIRKRFLRDIRRKIVPPRFESEIKTRSGEHRRVLWTNTLLRNEDGKPEGTCSLGLDITDRVRFESELLQRTKLESMGQLAAGMAHDFNN
ncbi:MAG TPA: PAS domain S-box protein, partial [Polyangiaceae bacterium]|nr:PAS domain S-box protein [Polyangiaceae bacterium]